MPFYSTLKSLWPPAYWTDSAEQIFFSLISYEKWITIYRTDVSINILLYPGEDRVQSAIIWILPVQMVEQM
jgi:hypothetical protein